jgi:hypothetical protein
MPAPDGDDGALAEARRRRDERLDAAGLGGIPAGEREPLLALQAAARASAARLAEACEDER